MIAGQRPKPSKIKEIEGSRAHIAKSKKKRDPTFFGAPKAPKRMNSEAQQIWRDCVSSMPETIVARVDVGILERYCTAYARWIEINYTIEDEGIQLVTEKGYKYNNPLLPALYAAAKEMHQTGGDLGFSPVSRARLATVPSQGDDKMAVLLSGDSITADEVPWTMSETKQ